MTGQLYIDGKDAYTIYGVYVVDGGYDELIAMPPLKSVDTNDWQEEDGIEADLSAPVLDTKDIQLKIAAQEAHSRYFSLIDRLSDGAYHTFDCVGIGRTFTLRLVSVSVTGSQGDFTLLTLKLANDYPLNGYTYSSPISTLPSDESYTLDGLPLSEYGVRVLQGSLTEIMKTPNVKQNMLRNIKTVSGAIYDPATVTFKSKDVKLTCLMTAPTMETLWHNWDALLYDLTKPDERMLWVEALEKDFYFYYKSCSVSEFYVDGKIWLKFELTFVFTHDMMIEDDDEVLATENNIIVFTEDGTWAIEMLPSRYNSNTVRFVNGKATLRLSSDGNIRFNN